MKNLYLLLFSALLLSGCSQSWVVSDQNDINSDQAFVNQQDSTTYQSVINIDPEFDWLFETFSESFNRDIWNKQLVVFTKAFNEEEWLHDINKINLIEIFDKTGELVFYTSTRDTFWFGTKFATSDINQNWNNELILSQQESFQNVQYYIIWDIDWKIKLILGKSKWDDCDSTYWCYISNDRNKIVSFWISLDSSVEVYEHEMQEDWSYKKLETKINKSSFIPPQPDEMSMWSIDFSKIENWFLSNYIKISIEQLFGDCDLWYATVKDINGTITCQKKESSWPSENIEDKDSSILWYWFMPDMASVINIEFFDDKRFIFNDYNDKLQKSEALKWSYEIIENKLKLDYDDRPWQTFTYEKWEYDIYYITDDNSNYYLVRWEKVEDIIDRKNAVLWTRQLDSNNRSIIQFFDDYTWKQIIYNWDIQFWGFVINWEELELEDEDWKEYAWTLKNFSLSNTSWESFTKLPRWTCWSEFFWRDVLWKFVCVPDYEQPVRQLKDNQQLWRPSSYLDLDLPSSLTNNNIPNTNVWSNIDYLSVWNSDNIDPCNCIWSRSIWWPCYDWIWWPAYAWIWWPAYAGIWWPCYEIWWTRINQPSYISDTSAPSLNTSFWSDTTTTKYYDWSSTFWSQIWTTKSQYDSWNDSITTKYYDGSSTFRSPDATAKTTFDSWSDSATTKYYEWSSTFWSPDITSKSTANSRDDSITTKYYDWSSTFWSPWITSKTTTDRMWNTVTKYYDWSSTFWSPIWTSKTTNDSWGKSTTKLYDWWNTFGAPIWTYTSD